MKWIRTLGRLRRLISNNSVFVILLLLIISSVKSDLISCFSDKSLDSTSKEVKNASSEEVHCTLEITNQSSTIAAGATANEVQCLNENTVRIIGEYGVLRILCSALFPLDLEYSGFQPTEAIKVQFSKEIKPNSSRQLISYKLELKVYSPTALYDFYNKNDRDAHKHGIPHTSSRTGNFKIHDVFNTSRSKSIYLFLEDDISSLSLMRNKYTLKSLIKDENNDSIIIPCRPSHYNANISLYLETNKNDTNSTRELPIDNQTVTYSPTSGFTLSLSKLSATEFADEFSSSTKLGYFICKLTDEIEQPPGWPTTTENKLLASTLRFKFPPEEQVPKYGFEDLPTGSIQENINIHSQVVVVDNYNFQINIDCIVDNPTDSIMTIIEAKSPSHSHLVQEFVFPSYINGSYTGIIGVKSSPPGVLTLRGVSMAGLIFCMSKRIVGNDSDYKVLEFATGFDRKVRFFKYGQDWSYFDVTESPAGNHLQIIPGILANDVQAAGSGNVQNTIYYINQTYIFKCRVRVHGLAPPVIWYQQLEDDTIIEEYIDYTLDDENFSHFNLTITSVTKIIYASASFWDRQLWKNVSLPIKQNRKEGVQPRIINDNFNMQFILGTSNQVLKCEAVGDPKPSLRWIKNSKVLKTENSTDSLILEFPLVGYPEGGDYVCTAKNVFGSISRTFSIEIVEEERVNYFINVGIPTAVFIIATLGTYVFFRYFRKEPVGLTKKEIEAFEQGSPEFTKELDYMVPENALNIPYNKSYEVEEKYFQIATCEILGSGQFGIVYKGIVKGDPVAVKTLKENADKEYLKALLSELKIMCYLGKHEHLIELIGANTAKLGKGLVYLFVELCSNGSLEQYLKTNRKNFVPDLEYPMNGNSSYVQSTIFMTSPDSLNTQQLLTWSYQISKAMEYLASKKVIHGDLATRNVLISANMQIKVTDFGLSRQLYNYALYVKKNEDPLPWRWMAVESLRDLVFSIQSDVWSFGVTLWEIFTLCEVPYPGLTWDLEFIEKLEHGLRMLKPKYANQKLYEDIILQCWKADPESRPSFEFISQYLLNLINVKPLPPHYIKHSDLLTTIQVGDAVG